MRRWLPEYLQWLQHPERKRERGVCVQSSNVMILCMNAEKIQYLTITCIRILKCVALVRGSVLASVLQTLTWGHLLHVILLLSVPTYSLWNHEYYYNKMFRLLSHTQKLHWSCRAQEFISLMACEMKLSVRLVVHDQVLGYHLPVSSRQNSLWLRCLGFYRNPQWMAALSWRCAEQSDHPL